MSEDGVSDDVLVNVDEAEVGDAPPLDSLRALVAPAEAIFCDAKIVS